MFRLSSRTETPQPLPKNNNKYLLVFRWNFTCFSLYTLSLVPSPGSAGHPADSTNYKTGIIPYFLLKCRDLFTFIRSLIVYTKLEFKGQCDALDAIIRQFLKRRTTDPKKFVLPKAVYLKEKEQILTWSAETDAGNISKIS